MSPLFAGSGGRQQGNSNGVRHHKDGGNGHWSSSSAEARFTNQHIVHPRIDTINSSGNTSVIVGKQVLLRCVVRDLGEEAVREGFSSSSF